MEWFPWYPERYKTKTLHLTAEQDGIYRRLIDHYMETRRPLPDNDIALARIAGVTPECFEHAGSILRAFFKHGKYGVLTHQTCDEMLNEQDGKAKFRTERAKNAAEKRWSNQTVTKSRNAHSMPIAMLGDATVTETVKNKNNIIAPDGVSSSVWNDFVAHRKVKKAPITQTALKGFQREADKAKMTLEQAIEMSVMRGWTGFNAEWVKPTTKTPEPSRKQFDENSPQRLALRKAMEETNGHTP